MEENYDIKSERLSDLIPKAEIIEQDGLDDCDNVIIKEETVSDLIPKAEIIEHDGLDDCDNVIIKEETDLGVDYLDTELGLPGGNLLAASPGLNIKNEDEEEHAAENKSGDETEPENWQNVIIKEEIDIDDNEIPAGNGLNSAGGNSLAASLVPMCKKEILDSDCGGNDTVDQMEKYSDRSTSTLKEEASEIKEEKAAGEKDEADPPMKEEPMTDIREDAMTNNREEAAEDTQLNRMNQEPGPGALGEAPPTAAAAAGEKDEAHHLMKEEPMTDIRENAMTNNREEAAEDTKLNRMNQEPGPRALGEASPTAAAVNAPVNNWIPLHEISVRRVDGTQVTGVLLISQGSGAEEGSASNSKEPRYDLRAALFSELAGTAGTANLRALTDIIGGHTSQTAADAVPGTQRAIEGSGAAGTDNGARSPHSGDQLPSEPEEERSEDMDTDNKDGPMDN